MDRAKVLERYDIALSFKHHFSGAQTIPDIATFEDDKGVYNQQDAEGFIKLNALRMRIAAKSSRHNH